MNTSQEDFKTELKEVQEECMWLVEIGAMTKQEAMIKCVDKALEMIQALKMPEPVDPQGQMYDEWAEQEYGYMTRGEN